MNVDEKKRETEITWESGLQKPQENQVSYANGEPGGGREVVKGEGSGPGW